MSVTELFSIILSGISAISAACAAWIMWRTQKWTIRASLYRERKEIMEALLSLIYYWNEVGSPPFCDETGKKDPNETSDTLNKFKNAKTHAKMVFPDEIYRLFDEYQSLAAEYCMLNYKKVKSKSDWERMKQINEKIASEKQFNFVLKTFRKHMAADA